MSEEIFFNNIERRMVDIGIQVKHASQIGISNLAKSGYYRFAILLACTIVEALLFRLVKKNLDENGEKMGEVMVYKYPHNIPPRYLNNKAVICIQEKEEICLSNQTKFSDLIGYANRNEIINERKKLQLEKIMRLRNRIHLQSLRESDRGYTKKKLENVFNIINYLVKK